MGQQHDLQQKIAKYTAQLEQIAIQKKEITSDPRHTEEDEDIKTAIMNSLSEPEKLINCEIKAIEARISSIDEIIADHEQNCVDY